METKFTKGEWIFEQTDKVDSGLDKFIKADPYDVSIAWAYNEEDAKLISAAPIMFQTLVSIIQDIDNIECVRDLKGTEITAREIARKAIKKAL